MDSTSIEKNLASEGERGAVWDVRPFQLVSLLDMKKYYLVALQNLASIIVGLYDNPLGGIEKSFSANGKDVITTEHAAKFNEALNQHERHVKYTGLKQSLKYINTMRGKLATNEYKYGQYEADVEILQDRENHELEDIVFGFIPAELAPYYQQKELFGAQVNANFPSAAQDIKEAGNCYAHGNDTAAVFHLMRVLEYGLRALAKKLRISFKTKKGAIIPIDLQEWGNIIGAIETKIDAMKTRRKSRQKAEDLQFYSEAAKEFRYFKDAWRNYVMHTKAMYDPHDAAKVMEHVKEFMQHIATRLKE
jgi:hypothetical protein